MIGKVARRMDVRKMLPEVAKIKAVCPDRPRPLPMGMASLSMKGMNVEKKTVNSGGII